MPLKLYLAYQKKDKSWVNTWALEMTKLTGHKFVNPAFYKSKYTTMPNDQFKLIRQCDGVMAIINKGTQFSVPIKMFYAKHILHMPVFALILSKDLYEHAWLYRFASMVFVEKKECTEFLDALNKSKWSPKI